MVGTDSAPEAQQPDPQPGGAPLVRWVEDLAAALDLETDVPLHELLDVTREVAHGVTRVAGPITTYLVGQAVARGMSAEEAIASVRRVLEEH